MAYLFLGVPSTSLQHSSPHKGAITAPISQEKKRRLGIPLEFLPSWLSPSSLQLALTPPFAPKWVRKGRFWTPRQLDFYPVWLSPSNLQPALASLSPLCGRGGWRLDGLMQARCSPNWPSRCSMDGSTQAKPLMNRLVCSRTIVHEHHEPFTNRSRTGCSRTAFFTLMNIVSVTPSIYCLLFVPVMNGR